MRQIVEETWLTKFVAVFGDSALSTLNREFYANQFMAFIAWGSVTIALFTLAFAINRKSFSPRIIYVLVALFFASPYDQKPVGFIVVDTLASGVKFGFERGVNAFSSNSDQSNMPPGIVMEMIVAASSHKLGNEKTKALLYSWVATCLPNALRIDGSPALFDDIFNFQTRITQSSLTGRRTPSFDDKVLNQSALKNDNSFERVMPGTNCHAGLTKLRVEFSRDLDSSPNTVASRVISSKTNHDGSLDETTTGEWYKTWSQGGSAFKNLAMNLKMAHAAEYEKSRIIADKGWDLNDPAGNWYANTATDVGLREILSGSSPSTEMGYRWSDIKNVAANVAGNRWAFSLGASIKDLKELLEIFPYQLASIKLLLKILAPLAIFSIFFQSFKVFSLWSGAWLTASLTPIAISGLRSIGNSIILSKLGISNFVESNEVGFFSSYKSLSYGVDLRIARDLLDDFVPLSYSLISQEIDCIKYLTGFMLVASWFAGGAANGFVSMASNGITSVMTNSAISGAMKPIGRLSGAATSLGASALRNASPAGFAATTGLRAGRAFAKLQGKSSPPSYSFSQLTKEKEV